LVLTTHLIVLIAFLIVRYVLQFSLFGFSAKHPDFIFLVQRLDLSAMAVVFILAIAKIGDVYLIGRIDSPVSRYNLRRVANSRWACYSLHRHLGSVSKLVHDNRCRSVCFH